MHAEEVKRWNDLSNDADEDLELNSPELAQICICKDTSQLQQGQHDLDDVSCDLDKHPVAQVSAFVAQYVIRQLVELVNLALQKDKHCNERANRYRKL